jgi:hypothetical protein
MADDKSQDARFREAIAALDSGDLPRLRECLNAYPELPCERLDSPGPWLRDRIGSALESFFARPYLLWFVAEDPVRSGRLPPNVAEFASAIVEAAGQCAGRVLDEQLSYAVSLVAWSGVASETGCQVPLLGVLADAGANLAGAPENALVNGHFDAARYLVDRGAPLSLATALCLDRWSDAEALLGSADAEAKQFAFVLAALHARTEALKRLLPAITDVNRPSEGLYSHATPLHHAVGSGSLVAVGILVEAGADLTARDRAYNGTPLGWAEHAAAEAAAPKRQGYRDIAEYLRARGAAL